MTTHNAAIISYLVDFTDANNKRLKLWDELRLKMRNEMADVTEKYLGRFIEKNQECEMEINHLGGIISA